MKNVKINTTRQPALTRAVLKALGGGKEARSYVQDAANHGADSGFPGFTYYKDTVAFYERYRRFIWLRLIADSEEFGDNGVVATVENFGCFRSRDAGERRALRRAINALMLDCVKVNWDIPEQVDVANALAWYALEEVGRELTDF